MPPITYLIVVIYDIANNRRRNRLARALLAYGRRVQKSAFECRLSDSQLRQMLLRISPLIHPREDSLRIYQIAGEPSVYCFGITEFTEEPDFFIAD